MTQCVDFSRGRHTISVPHPGDDVLPTFIGHLGQAGLCVPAILWSLRVKWVQCRDEVHCGVLKYIGIMIPKGRLSPGVILNSIQLRNKNSNQYVEQKGKRLWLRGQCAGLVSPRIWI